MCGYLVYASPIICSNLVGPLTPPALLYCIIGSVVVSMVTVPFVRWVYITAKKFYTVHCSIYMCWGLLYDLNTSCSNNRAWNYTSWLSWQSVESNPKMVRHKVIISGTFAKNGWKCLISNCNFRFWKLLHILAEFTYIWLSQSNCFVTTFEYRFCSKSQLYRILFCFVNLSSCSETNCNDLIGSFESMLLQLKISGSRELKSL